MLPDAPCTLSTFPRESGQLCSPRGPVHFQSAPEPPKVHRFRRKFRPPDQPLYLLYVLLNLYTSRVCIGMGPYRGDSFRREYGRIKYTYSRLLCPICPGARHPHPNLEHKPRSEQLYWVPPRASSSSSRASTACLATETCSSRPSCSSAANCILALCISSSRRFCHICSWAASSACTLDTGTKASASRGRSCT